jgi:para-aminobenzoate synthetase/4-amino-4-deoxychorismate lyase
MTAVRLLRVPLKADCPPQAALRALSADRWPFALTGRWAGGGALVGSEPLRLAEPDEDPFALLDELPSVAGVADVDGPTDEGADTAAAHDGARTRGAEDGGDVPAPPDAVGGGWFGWLGYGLGRRVERLSPRPPRPVPLPAFQLGYYDHLLHLDRDGRWWFEALVSPAREPYLRERLALLRQRLAEAATAPPAPAPPAPAEPFRIAGAGALGHVAAVADCVERIAAGEVFQANVCLRFETAWEGDVAQLYAHASAQLRPAYGAAFPAPWGGIASLSPELFLRRRGRAVETAPIKGTTARAGEDRDPAAAAARAALSASAKDNAEHVMIVDLMRNDLGRVCTYGTVEAERTPEAQAHPGLWHLVSRVRGTLRPEVGDEPLLRATFPPGSVTGAPKVQALHVIGELEGSARELYTGAVGYASPLAGLELNVAIRTFEARDGRLWLGAGGGIVADSDPWVELEECHVKARPLIAAIGATVEEPSATSCVSLPTATVGRLTQLPRALSRTRHRPAPSRGVFETLLVQDGRPLRAAAHLARLERSVRALYDRALPDGLAERVAAVAAEASAALTAGGDEPAATASVPTRTRLRVALAPARDGSGSLAVAVEHGPLPGRTLPVELSPVVLPGGLGAHKWRDRDLLDRLVADGTVPPGTTPLLLDGDGALLEAAWGSVFVLEDGGLVTPADDGRILPGVTREVLLSVAASIGVEVRTERIDLARAASGDGLLVSSALGLALPARLTSGAVEDERSAADELAARLRALLREAEGTTASRSSQSSVVL